MCLRVAASGYRDYGVSGGCAGVAAARTVRSGAGVAAGAAAWLDGGGGGVAATFFLAQPAPKLHSAAIEITLIHSRKLVISGVVPSCSHGIARTGQSAILS